MKPSPNRWVYEDIVRKRILRYARKNMDLRKWPSHMKAKYYYLNEWMSKGAVTT